MPLRFILSLICTLGWILCFGRDVQAFSHPKHSFHSTPHVAPFTALERPIAQHFYTWFKNHYVRAPQHDKGLRLAAQHIARQLQRRALRTLPHRLVHAAMWLGGRSDKKLNIFAHAFTRPQSLLRALKRALARQLAGKRYNYFGLAIVGKKIKYCVLLLVRRGALLKPIPRWSIQGQTLWLRGRLLYKFKNPYFILGWPSGRVVKLKTRMLRHGHFLASWHITGAAPIRLQLMVKDDEGPWISAQCMIAVYPKNSSMTGQVNQLWKHYRHQLEAQPKAQIRWLSARTSKASHQQVERTLLRLVNQMRRKQNLRPFKSHVRLVHMARAHAKDMVQEHFFAHTSPQKGSFTERFARLYWRVQKARENIVAAYSPQEAYRSLFRSPIHRVNLLLPKAQYIGIGAARNHKGKWFFTQVFVETKKKKKKN